MPEQLAIHKPLVDDREYKALTLSNNLSVLLISDPTTDKASAALDVHVGHLCDPDEAPGLAHFCEHLLFMGTEKYPVENFYSQLLSSHSGHSNAFTSAENTNYYFDIQADHLEEALDVFAQFFIAPLFDDSCTDRELRAVDSENKKNLQQDHWRLYQLEKDLSNPEHPYRKFGTGNLETLKEIPEQKGLDIRKILLDFHEKYYSANIMKLVVLGKEPVDVLAKWAAEKFSAIKNKNIAVPSFPGHPLGPEQCQKTVFAKPVKDLRMLELTFAFPDTSPHYLTQPARYITHLIGHESGGSVLSLLKKKGWALGLSAGASRGGINFEFLKVVVDLTEEGQDHYEEIIEIVFAYIKMMKESKVQKWIFDESAKISSMAFQFKEKSAPSSYTCRVAGYMQEYSTHEALIGPYLMTEYKPELIEDFMKYLDPKNFRVFFVSPDIESDSFMQAKYYGTEYEVNDFSAEFVHKLQNVVVPPELHLPKPNIFVPDDFSLAEAAGVEIKYANIIKDTDIVRLWYKKDDTFKVPKANAWFLFTSPEVYATPLKCVMSRLIVDLLKDSLTEFSYYAETAQLTYTLDNNTEGILLRVEGYNDKLGILLTELVKKMKEMKVDPARFQDIKEQLERSYKNWNMESPHQHAMYYVNYITQESLWHQHEKLEALKDVTIEKVERFAQEMFSYMFIEALIHGNVKTSTALEWMNLVEETFSARAISQIQKYSKSRTHLIPTGHMILQSTVLNPENVNSAIEYVLQICETSDDACRTKLLLVAQILDEPCFDQLRTKEQLGYMVFSGVRRQTGIMGLRFIIQSERHPMYLEHRIESFLEQMKATIAALSDEDLAKHAESIATRLLEKNKNLNQESKKLWAHIYSQYYDFDLHVRDAESVKKVKKEELIEFYKEYVAVDATRRRKLSAHLTSQKMTAGEDLAEAETIKQKNEILVESDIPLLKARLELSKSAVPVKKIEEFKL